MLVSAHRSEPAHRPDLLTRALTVVVTCARFVPR